MQITINLLDGKQIVKGIKILQQILEIGEEESKKEESIKIRRELGNPLFKGKLPAWTNQIQVDDFLSQTGMFLTTRVRNLLMRQQINGMYIKKMTLSEFLKIESSELLKLDNCGRKSLNEIKQEFGIRIYNSK